MICPNCGIYELEHPGLTQCLACDDGSTEDEIADAEEAADNRARHDREQRDDDSPGGT